MNPKLCGIKKSATFVYNHGFKKHELAIIESIIEENAEIIIDRWHNYFKK